MFDRLCDDRALVFKVTPRGDHVELQHAAGVAKTLIPRQMPIEVERVCQIDDQDEARIVHTSRTPNRST